MADRPELLDVFSGAGGCSIGYHRAGYAVTGVDTDPAAGRRYPYRFIRADAMDVLADRTFLSRFAVVHASPPCQHYSITRHAHTVDHPDLLGPVRAALVEWGGTYVIENVAGAPMVNPLTLCGTMFDLTTLDTDGTTRLHLRRHRLFETNVWIMSPGPCRCADYRRRGWVVGGVYGAGSTSLEHARQVRHGGYTPASKQVRARLLGIDPESMTLDQMSQAIPPAYTAYIGAAVLEAAG